MPRRSRLPSRTKIFLSNRCDILVFDEAEDGFNNGDSLINKKSKAHLRKAWINHMLEDNS